MTVTVTACQRRWFQRFVPPTWRSPESPRPRRSAETGSARFLPELLIKRTDVSAPPPPRLCLCSWRPEIWAERLQTADPEDEVTVQRDECRLARARCRERRVWSLSVCATNRPFDADTNCWHLVTLTEFFFLCFCGSCIIAFFSNVKASILCPLGCFCFDEEAFKVKFPLLDKGAALLM